MNNLIEVKDLEIQFHLKEGVVRAVNGVTLSIAPNRSLGIVGESGCGKSVTAKAMMRILPSRAKIMNGSILFNAGAGEGGGRPVDLTSLPASGKELRRIRGGDIAMIFQEPMTSLSPVHTVGNQIIETILLHQEADKKEARDRAIEMLRLVGVPIPERRVDAFPHELSGGLRQRCMIAMALSCHPRLLIADEPTTALDVTIQAQILELIDRLRQELGMAVVMITHDLGVVAETTDEVAVMYLGRVVEQGPVKRIFDNPKHPYTLGLIDSIPRLGKGNAERLESIPGSVPNPFEPLPGCPFHPRCSECIKGVCDTGSPPLLDAVEENHRVACHLFSGKAGAVQAARPDEQNSPSQETP